jgi:hypothetical protein
MKFKISLKKITQDIIDKNPENKKLLVKKEINPGDICLKPWLFPSSYYFYFKNLCCTVKTVIFPFTNKYFSYKLLNTVLFKIIKKSFFFFFIIILFFKC